MRCSRPSAGTEQLPTHVSGFLTPGVSADPKQTVAESAPAALLIAGAEHAAPGAEGKLSALHRP